MNAPADDDDDDDGETFTPTSAAIAEACRLIQLGWTDSERRRRRTRTPARTVDTGGVKALALQRLEASLLDRRQGDRG